MQDMVFVPRARWGYATEYTTKIKATISSLMNLYLNQENQNSRISLTTNCLSLPVEKLAVICQKFYCDPAVNMAQCARKTSANILLTGEVREKM